MSSITGIFYRDGRCVDFNQIEKMNNSLAHRGHDGSNIWVKESVAMGHQMLFTTPESLHEQLPYDDKDSGLVITADARIDNRKELSEQLGIEDIGTVPDSYFILKSYQKWGNNCPNKLLGDFAFAIWDKNKEVLFCARDHMGVKPFYYYLTDDIFLFSTEIKAFTILGRKLNLNKKKLSYYLMYVIKEKKLTFYEDISRLPAANSIMVLNKSSRKWKYWELDPNYQVKLNSDKEYIEKFCEIFAESVKCRLRSSHPIGFELSGGLDSSSIVCMAKTISKKHNSPINTFAYVFDEFPEVNEVPYIEYVVNTGGINHHSVKVDFISLMNFIDKILWNLDQPSLNPYMPFIWNLYNEMKKEDIRIIMSGTSGDGTISHGEFCIKDLATSLQFKKTLKELKHYSKLANQSFARSLIDQVIFPSLPDFINNFFIRYVFKKSHKYILNKEFGMISGGREYYDKYIKNPTRQNSAKKYHYHVLNKIWGQSEDMDMICSAFDMELRYPYKDKRLIEFCYGIPNEMKFRLGWGRYLQRISMEGILPPQIQWRDNKTNFNPIIVKKLLLEKDRLDKIFLNNESMIYSFVDLNVILTFYQKYLLDIQPDVRQVRDLWLLMILDFWLSNNQFLNYNLKNRK
jgi:asparagine synthase (glutamine-hydrolysing)